MGKAQVSSQAEFVQILNLPFISFVTLGTLFNFSLPQFPLLYDGGITIGPTWWGYCED